MKYIISKFLTIWHSTSSYTYVQHWNVCGHLRGYSCRHPW